MAVPLPPHAFRDQTRRIHLFPSLITTNLPVIVDILWRYYCCICVCIVCGEETLSSAIAKMEAADTPWMLDITAPYPVSCHQCCSQNDTKTHQWVRLSLNTRTQPQFRRSDNFVQLDAVQNLPSHASRWNQEPKWLRF